MELNQDLSYPLSILVKAVGFRNLSSASNHVGLSQPQLSRIIARLEGDVGMELLDRKVRRQACWTPEALRLAEMFHRHQRRLESGIKSLQGEGKMKQIHIGTLEGLVPAAIELGEILFKIPPLELVTLDVYDRSDLESKFLAGDLDLMLNTRVPSQAKPRFIQRLGYQTLDAVQLPGDYALFSSFEFAQLRKKPPARTLVTNSLSVRRQWFEKLGGQGFLPSEMSDRARKNAEEVLLLGGEWLEGRLWEVLLKKLGS